VNELRRYRDEFITAALDARRHGEGPIAVAIVVSGEGTPVSGVPVYRAIKGRHLDRRIEILRDFVRDHDANGFAFVFDAYATPPGKPRAEAVVGVICMADGRQEVVTLQYNERVGGPFKEYPRDVDEPLVSSYGAVFEDPELPQPTYSVNRKTGERLHVFFSRDGKGFVSRVQAAAAKRCKDAGDRVILMFAPPDAPARQIAF
jgi:hypothetical protein